MGTAGEQLGEQDSNWGKKVLCTLYYTSAGLKALRVFQHMSRLLPWMFRYVLEPDTAAGQAQQLQENALTTDADNSATPEEKHFYRKFLTSLCIQVLLFPFKTSR